MELMSSLLLCALVAYLPQALAMDIFSKFNLFKSGIEQLPEPKQLEKNHLIVDITDGHISEAPTDSEFNLIYLNDGCKKSRDCLADVVKMFRDDIYVLMNNPAYGVTEDELLPLKAENTNRITREIITEDQIKPSKRNKPKKKHNKSALVSRYSIDGEVYGLKVKENINESILCRVYNVIKSYNCNSPESEAFLASKGGKKEDKITSSSTTSTKKAVHSKISPSFKKRDTDPTAAENFSLSVEEMCE